MKIRIGFVSNSSSQSFVMVGADISNIDEAILKKALVKKFNYKLPECTVDTIEDVSIGEITDDEFEEADEGHYLGLNLACGDELETFSLSFAEVEEAAQKVRALFDELGIPVEVKLIGGTECC